MLKAVSAGELTLEEAELTSNLLETMRQAFETVQLAAEIEALKDRARLADVDYHVKTRRCVDAP